MIELVPVMRGDLRARWQRDFMPGVNEVIRKCGTDYIAEDIYRELSEERSFLYEILQNGAWLGFSVVSQYTDRFSLRTALCLDLTWMISNQVDYRALVEEFDDLARHIGASKVEWMSPREGWTRVIMDHGYYPSYRTYAREVPL